MAKPNELKATTKIKAENKKLPSTTRPIYTLALSLFLLSMTPNSNAASLNLPEASQTTQTKSLPSAGTINQKAIMALTTNEKELAAKLGYDEQILTIIKNTLQPEMAIIKSGGLETEDLDFFQEPTGNEEPLLEEDRQNFEKIAKDFPELKPLTDKALERYSRMNSNFNEYLEAAKKKEMGEEKYIRYRRFNNAVKPYSALIKQELILKQANNSNNNQLVSPEVFNSDEALERAIESMKQKFTGKELHPENKGTVQLALKFSIPLAEGLPAPEILEKLQDDLVQKGYRLSELPKAWTERKSFQSKQEAENFINSGAINHPLIPIGEIKEQKSRQYTMTYPPDQIKLPENNHSDKTSEDLSNHFYAELTVTPQAHSKSYLLSEVCEPPDSPQLLPGSNVRKIAGNRWQITVPARYIAQRTIMHATVLKVPAESLGLELLHANMTIESAFDAPTERLVDKLKNWDQKYGLTILEAAAGSIKIRFKRLPDDLSELSTEMFLACPPNDLRTSEETIASKLREAAHQLRKTNKATLRGD